MVFLDEICIQKTDLVGVVHNLLYLFERLNKAEGRRIVPIERHKTLEHVTYSNRLIYFKLYNR